MRESLYHLRRELEAAQEARQTAGSRVAALEAERSTLAADHRALVLQNRSLEQQHLAILERLAKLEAERPNVRVVEVPVPYNSAAMAEHAREGMARGYDEGRRRFEDEQRSRDVGRQTEESYRQREADVRAADDDRRQAMVEQMERDEHENTFAQGSTAAAGYGGVRQAADGSLFASAAGEGFSEKAYHRDADSAAGGATAAPGSGREPARPAPDPARPVPEPAQLAPEPPATPLADSLRSRPTDPTTRTPPADPLALRFDLNAAQRRADTAADAAFKLCQQHAHFRALVESGQGQRAYAEELLELEADFHAWRLKYDDATFAFRRLAATLPVEEAARLPALPRFPTLQDVHATSRAVLLHDLHTRGDRGTGAREDRSRGGQGWSVRTAEAATAASASAAREWRKTSPTRHRRPPPPSTLLLDASVASAPAGILKTPERRRIIARSEERRQQRQQGGAQSAGAGAGAGLAGLDRSVTFAGENTVYDISPANQPGYTSQLSPSVRGPRRVPVQYGTPTASAMPPGPTASSSPRPMASRMDLARQPVPLDLGAEVSRVEPDPDEDAGGMLADKPRSPDYEDGEAAADASFAEVAARGGVVPRRERDAADEALEATRALLEESTASLETSFRSTLSRTPTRHGERGSTTPRSASSSRSRRERESSLLASAERLRSARTQLRGALDSSYRDAVGEGSTSRVGFSRSPCANDVGDVSIASTTPSRLSAAGSTPGRFYPGRRVGGAPSHRQESASPPLGPPPKSPYARSVAVRRGADARRGAAPQGAPDADWLGRGRQDQKGSEVHNASANASAFTSANHSSFAGDGLLPTARHHGSSPFRPGRDYADRGLQPTRRAAPPSTRNLDGSLDSVANAPRIPPAATSTPMMGSGGLGVHVTSGDRDDAARRDDDGWDDEGEAVAETRRVDTSALSDEIDRALAAAASVRQRSDRLNASLQHSLEGGVAGINTDS
jgi:hypothetical protein